MNTDCLVLMDDLIDSDIEETSFNANSVWTEQALDSFISLLKNVQKDNLGKDLHDLLPLVTKKMLERKFTFSNQQIERKFNSLKKMYTNKMETNQPVEPELVKLFGDVSQDIKKRENHQENPPPKKIKISPVKDVPQAQNTEEPEFIDENRKLWSTSSTKVFLDLLEELRPKLGEELCTKKQMWKEICRRMERRGYSYSYSQVENKWKALLRVYRGRLETMRSGKSSIRRSSPNLKAFPELFELSASTEQEPTFDFNISFANDQKLPFDDDGYDGYDEEPVEFEEACSMPDAEIPLNEVDPVLVDVKPSTQQLKNAEASASKKTKNPLELSDSDKLYSEIEKIRKDKRKQQTDLVQIKKLQLQAYRERTVQIGKIGDGLNALFEYLKKKDGLL